MSLEAITWAIKQPVQKATTKFVLVMLANLASPNQRGQVVAWPSIKYLCDSTSLNRKTVQACLGQLRDLGLIEDTGERVGATQSIPVYSITCGLQIFTEQAQKRSCSKNGATPKTTGSRPVFSPKQAQKRATDTKGSVFIQSGDREADKQRLRTAEANSLTEIRALLTGAIT